MLHECVDNPGGELWYSMLCSTSQALMSTGNNSSLGSN